MEGSRLMMHRLCVHMGIKLSPACIKGLPLGREKDAAKQLHSL